MYLLATPSVPVGLVQASKHGADSQGLVSSLLDLIPGSADSNSILITYSLVDSS